MCSRESGQSADEGVGHPNDLLRRCEERSGATVIVPLPTRLDAFSASRLGNALNALREASAIAIDFRDLAVVDPFGMLYASVLARDMIESGVTFDASNADANSYYAYMGLLREFGHNIRLDREPPKGNDRHIPITHVTRDDLFGPTRASHAAHVGDAVEDLANGWAQILTQSEGGELVDSLTYCLREIVRNSFEHSGSDDILVCAQYRPSADRVDLAFADRGCGVRRTLTRNPRVIADTDLDAIEISLLPGISGTHRPRMRSRSNDPWSNTGYGLFMTQRICREGGAFTMASGTAMLRLAGDVRIPVQDSANVGTVVGLSIRLGSLESLQKKLVTEFSIEAREISKRLKGANVSASAASLTLRMNTNTDTGDKR
jgi:hypothetical protein